MTDTDRRHDARTVLIPQMERPKTPAPAEDGPAEPRTAMFRPPDLVLDATEVEALQMGALLGGALSARRRMPPPPMRSRARIRWGLWFGRLMVASVLATFFLAIVALAMTGVEERARVESKGQAQLLHELLLTGSLVEAEAHLARLEALIAEAKSPRAQAALRARAEATLYRFHDANPARRDRALRLLASEKKRASSDGWIAESLLVSTAKRASHLEKGAALALPRDADPVALRAALEAHSGRWAEARSDFVRAEVVEPAHVIHLYGLFSVEQLTGDEREARMVLERMEDVSPKSPWTRLASARSEPEAADRAKALLALAEDTSLSAVPRALAAENALLDVDLALEPGVRMRLVALQTSLLHKDDTFMSELPLPPRRPRESSRATEATAEPTAASPNTIVAPVIEIRAPSEAPTPKKKRKARRKRRAR